MLRNNYIYRSAAWIDFQLSDFVQDFYWQMRCYGSSVIRFCLIYTGRSVSNKRFSVTVSLTYTYSIWMLVISRLMEVIMLLHTSALITGKLISDYGSVGHLWETEDIESEDWTLHAAQLACRSLFTEYISYRTAYLKLVSPSVDNRTEYLCFIV
jgi:hypothetical protein